MMTNELKTAIANAEPATTTYRFWVLARVNTSDTNSEVSWKPNAYASQFDRIAKLQDLGKEYPDAWAVERTSDGVVLFQGGRIHTRKEARKAQAGQNERTINQVWSKI